MPQTKDPLEIPPDVVQTYIDKYKLFNHIDELQQTKESINWFRKFVSKQVNVKYRRMLNSSYNKIISNSSKNILLGNLYFFKYNAWEAGDKELQVYDEYPMIFIFNMTLGKDGMHLLHAINIHYLKPSERMMFYFQLLKIRSSKGITSKSRMMKTWNQIKSVASSKYYQKCVHTYRIDRIQTPTILEIPPEHWQICVFLNLQYWQPAPLRNKNKHTLSQSEIRKRIYNK